LTLNAVTPELLKAADNAEATAGDLNQMLGQLLQGLDGMHGGFVGAAGTTFQSVKGNIEADMRSMTKALGEVAEGIRSAGRDFSAADSQAQEDVSKAAQGSGDIMNRLRR
jgi:ESAT-6 family protein